MFKSKSLVVSPGGQAGAPSRRRALGALLQGVGGALLLTTGEAAAAPPVTARYYIRLRTVELASPAASAPPAAAPAPAESAAPDGGITAAAAPRDGDGGGVVGMAQGYLVEALGKRPEVVLSLEGIADNAPAATVAAELKRRSLKGYEVTLRILRQDRSIKPPPAGRRFRLLEQNVKLALVGTLYPGQPTLALGGDGESTVQIEVGSQISDKQQREAMADALKDAVQQAVDQALRKLMAGPMQAPKSVPRRRK